MNDETKEGVVIDLKQRVSEMTEPLFDAGRSGIR